MQEPITDDEYAVMHYLRRSTDYPAEGTSDYALWADIYDRFREQYPHSLERDAWHEAAHVVVAHRLGGYVDSVTRDENGAITNIMTFEPPHVDFFLWAVAMTAGYLIEQQEVGRVDPAEASEVGVKFRERWRQRRREDAPPAEILEGVGYAETVAIAIAGAYPDAIERVAQVLMSEPWPLERERLTELLADVPYGESFPMDGPLGENLQAAMSMYEVWYGNEGAWAPLTGRGTSQAAEAFARQALNALHVNGGSGRIVVRNREALLQEYFSEVV